MVSAMNGELFSAAAGGGPEALTGLLRAAEEATSAVADQPATVTIDRRVLLAVLIGAALVIAALAVVVIMMKKRDAVSPAAEEDDRMSGTVVGQHVSDVTAASVHGLGSRKNQEDSFGMSQAEDAELVRDKGLLAIVADGMGGLEAGEEVSSGLVMTMLQSFKDDRPPIPPSAELDRLLRLGNARINELLRKTVGIGKSGSTLLAAIIKDGRLDWISVGDSRICLLRQGRLCDLNKKHNYGAELDERARRGEISEAEAKSDPHRAGLTSFIGMGELKYVDRSVRPIELAPGDKVILMSDGIFNTLRDEEIIYVLSCPAGEAAARLENSVLAKHNPYQDNFTALILEYTGTDRDPGADHEF